MQVALSSANRMIAKHIIAKHVTQELNMKKIGLAMMACSVGIAAHAQSTVVDPLDGSNAGLYTTTMVNIGASTTNGVSFTENSGGLSANYVGTGTTAQQAVYLAPTASLAPAFTVGQMLTVNTAVPASSTAEDFGLVIASTANPTAAGTGGVYDQRKSFDWTSISVRPNGSGGNIRVNFENNGAAPVTTGGALTITPLTTVSQLAIQWNSADVFTVGYIDNTGTFHPDETLTFTNPSSTIGSAIGFYGDIRLTSTSLGTFSNLSIQPIPEPSTMALCGVGIAGWLLLRRKL
jgi:PEP-CTERM motif